MALNAVSRTGKTQKHLKHSLRKTKVLAWQRALGVIPQSRYSSGMTGNAGLGGFLERKSKLKYSSHYHLGQSSAQRASDFLLSPRLVYALVVGKIGGVAFVIFP